MRSSDPSFAPALRSAFLLVSLALLLATGLSAAETPSGSTWISLETDVFETLQDEGFRFQLQPLVQIEESSGIVITQVHRSDLAKISALFHDTFHRCAGFMRHDTLEDAQRTVAAAVVTRDQLFGSQIDYIIDQPLLVSSLHAQLQEAPILDTITSLSTQFDNRYFEHPSGVAASNWIRDLWLGYAAGREDVTVELYDHSWPQPSVVLTIDGTLRPDEVVVLGGHMDSIASGTSDPNFSAPGADDNASGIAVLSEAIRVAMATGFQPQRTVKFMAYAAEEVGLDGSQAIAGDFAADGVDVVAVMQFDMTAFNGSVEDIGILNDFVDPTLTAFIRDLADTYLSDLTWIDTNCGFPCSDHAAWTFEGYPAAMAFESRFGQHNGSIHSTGDTVSTFGNTAAHAIKFARLATAFMAEIGVDVDSSIFIDGFESGDTTRWTTTEP